MSLDLKSIERVALALARADDQYRGFEPFAQPPPNANSDWYYDNISGWSWYCYLAQQVLKIKWEQMT